MLFLLWAPGITCVQCALYGHGAHNKNTLGAHIRNNTVGLIKQAHRGRLTSIAHGINARINASKRSLGTTIKYASTPQR